MNKFLDMNSPFFQFMDKVANLIILNILFLIGCIPIVTIGTSITATYYVALKIVRGEDPYIVKNFFKAFQSNLKQSVILHIILVTIAVFLYMDFALVYNPDTSFGTGTFILLIILGVIYGLVFLYCYPYMAQFYNSIPRIIQNSLFMAIRHLTKTVMLFIITLLPIWCFFLLGFDYFVVVIVLMFLLGFSGIITLNSILLVQVFDKYIPEKEDTYVPSEERCFEDESHVNSVMPAEQNLQEKEHDEIQKENDEV